MSYLEDQLDRIRALHESSRTIAELLAKQAIVALTTPYAKEVAELRTWIKEHRPDLHNELTGAKMTTARVILNCETRLNFGPESKVGPSCVAYLEALKAKHAKKQECTGCGGDGMIYSCCGNTVVGADYMGLQEQLCCGSPDTEPCPMCSGIVQQISLGPDHQKNS